MNLDKYKSGISESCRKYKVKKLEIFGSFLRSDFSENSDIDIFYKFTGDEDMFNRFMGLKNDLEKIFERKIDLVNEECIKNSYMKENIKHTKRLLIYAA
ncbi:MAG: nucleotidyltransferase domain-containing protein [Spirochaetales bacterium]|nr:nucleotidyltransferase domain-containing protein [Spirochaetales bacterium]